MVAPTGFALMRGTLQNGGFMKKTVIIGAILGACLPVLLVIALIAFIILAPVHAEITGIENFTENDDQFGLNDDLLPGDTHFLSRYAYEEGTYYYRFDEAYKSREVKSFVLLRYSEEVYPQAKEAAEKAYAIAYTQNGDETYNAYVITKLQYGYENFTFTADQHPSENSPLDVSAPGIRMFGFDDESRTLIFFGYINRDDTKDITQAGFPEFFREEFGPYLSDTKSANDQPAGE